MNESEHWADNHAHVDRYIFESANKNLLNMMNKHLDECERCREKVKKVLFMYLAIRDYSREDIKHFITINQYIDEKKPVKAKKVKKFHWKPLVLIGGLIIIIVSALLWIRKLDVEPVAIVSDGKSGYLDGSVSKTKTNDPVDPARSTIIETIDSLPKEDIEKRSYIRVSQYTRKKPFKVRFTGPGFDSKGLFPYSFKAEFLWDSSSQELIEIQIKKNKKAFANLSAQGRELLNGQIEIIFTNKIRYRNEIKLPGTFFKIQN